MNENLLRGKRAEHNLSQEEMAERLSITRTTYRFKETGQREFTNSEMIKLVKVLNLNMNEVNSIFFNNEIT